MRNRANGEMGPIHQVMPKLNRRLPMKNSGLLTGLPGAAPAAAPDSDDVYAELRARWRAFLLGGTGDDLDQEDPAIQIYIKKLDERAKGYWRGMNGEPGGTGAVFSDLPVSGAAVIDSAASGNMGTTLRRLLTLALAWATKGCALYQNAGALKGITAAADCMAANHFKIGRYSRSDRGKKPFGNWYHWEVTCPIALGSLAMVLYDELTEDQIRTYAETIRYYVNTCTEPMLADTDMTGGNLLLKANGLAQAGILLNNPKVLTAASGYPGETLLENVQRGVRSALRCNDPSMLFTLTGTEDGFYADGSYIQHQGIPYIAGYGTDLYRNYAVLARVLGGTDWDVKPGAGDGALIYDFVFEGVEPFLAGGRTMDMVAGRDITRSYRDDHIRTADLLSALLCMRGTFPTGEQNGRFDRLMKYCISQDEAFYYNKMDSISSLRIAGELMADSGVAARSGYALTKTFAMDRTVHHTDGFTLGIAMQSARTFAHEFINEEGKRTWNIANGMVFLYDADKEQYGGGYWCTVDPARLPGTTAEHVIYAASGFGDRNANVYDWTGGSSIGSSGVAGMHMRALGGDEHLNNFQAGPRGGADMKKSWFMFGDRILMLGSSITSASGNRVETTVENRRLREDGSNIVTVDGERTALSTSPASPTILANPTWMHLEGNVHGADIGYYFPQKIILKAVKDARTGDWSAQGACTGSATGTYATFYVDHGVRPEDAGYAYLLLPGRSAGETAAYAAAPDIEILRKDGGIHAARDNRENVTAVNFWEKGSVAGIEVSAPACVTVKREGGRVAVGVSDPTQKAASITVTLAIKYCGTLSRDSAITVDERAGCVSFTVDVKGSLGGTRTAVFLAAE